MKRMDVDYWYTFGRAMAQLEECFILLPCDITTRGWSRVSTAAKWLVAIANGRTTMLPGTQRLASELLDLLNPLLAEHPGRVDERTQSAVNVAITAFHNSVKIGAQEVYTFWISGRGAYSAGALMDDASCHLSELAQKTLAKAELKDFAQAGACLAVGLGTATGFHAMRALEAEARRYHMAVTANSAEVDWTLNTVINGNSGKGQFGLRDRWKKEGAKDESHLLLIITLLSSVTQVYRNPIMHPEMTLDIEKAKLVFDTSALAISAMVDDRERRRAAVTI